jgi:integrase
MFKRLPERCEVAKIPALTPNDLRRTVATRLIESGVDAYTTAKITRHATLIMLKRVYDRSNTATTRKLIDKPTGTKRYSRAPRKRPLRPPRNANLADFTWWPLPDSNRDSIAGEGF